VALSKFIIKYGKGSKLLVLQIKKWRTVITPIQFILEGEPIIGKTSGEVKIRDT
jgi:hypothetical protein